MCYTNIQPLYGTTWFRGPGSRRVGGSADTNTPTVGRKLPLPGLTVDGLGFVGVSGFGVGVDVPTVLSTCIACRKVCGSFAYGEFKKFF